MINIFKKYFRRQKIVCCHYLNQYKWFRSCCGGTWYKHQFSSDALEMSVNFTGTWWARYGQINRYSYVIEIEVY